jgi:hypothetical protein
LPYDARYIEDFDSFNFFNEKLLIEHDKNIMSLYYLINDQLGLERSMKWMQNPSYAKVPDYYSLANVEVQFSDHTNFIVMIAMIKVFLMSHFTLKTVFKEHLIALIQRKWNLKEWNGCQFYTSIEYRYHTTFSFFWR